MMVPLGGADDAGSSSVEVSPAEGTVRSLFPETFLHLLQGLGGSGSADITRTMPDTITSWVASAFCSGLRGGFGLSESASITTFKPFFAQIQLPYSVKRGEVLPLKISVFNYHAEELSVEVKLSPSQDYSVEEGSSSTAQVCVKSSKTSVVEIPVKFSKIGKVDITVSAKTSGSACRGRNSIQASDALRRSLVVKPEGFPQEEVETAFVCQERASAPTKVERFELAMPNQLVPDSQRAKVQVVGDLIAPSVGNLGSMVKKPTGCGEQTMINFVPNILVRRYLEEVKLLTESLKDRTTQFMREGYQRELKFRHKDASYSAFGEGRYKGSLWLTAYVVKTYVAASRYIIIDTNEITISTRWIVSKQESSGAFKPYGDLFHKEMRGGVGNGADEALTAYVLLTLVEASTKSAVESAAIDKAVNFLVASSRYSTLYAEVLVAHALLVAGKKAEGRTRVDKLLAKGTRMGGQLYWMGDRSGPAGGSSAVDVEMTSYMVLSLLKLGGSKYMPEAALAIKWVNTQRNSLGGFKATQDTVVALTALTEFAIQTYSPTAAVTVDVTALQNFQLDVKIDSTNRLLTRQKWLPIPLQLPNQVTFRIGGEGCTVVQSVFRYNTKVAFPDPKFNLNAVITKVNKYCSFTLKVCTSFKDPNKKSNMAMVEIEMVSGFVTINRSLKKLEDANVIRNSEFKEGKAVLYFDKFDATEVCFEVRFIRAVEVKKLKPAIVRVYDYYAEEDRFEVEYGPPECPN